MDNQSSHLEFAVIGHQDCWEKIRSLVNFLSTETRDADKIAEVYSYIPPRRLFDIEVNSITGQTVKGLYIETFISPDELGPRYWRKNVFKVQEAAVCARSFGVDVAGLGGFTSIVLEGKDSALNENSSTKFTTGNTLTAAFIVKGVEKACKQFNRDLENLKVLIIGATGDIGSACVEYFSGKVDELLICARQAPALALLQKELIIKGCKVRASTNVQELLPEANVVIAIASSAIKDFNPALCKEDVIICDAGYPKNLIYDWGKTFAGRLFCGGMGHVSGGFNFTPSFYHNLYDFPLQNVAHGCLLEAAILALEKNHSSYSSGKGKIKLENMERIYLMAQKHGIIESPLFNPLYVWPVKELNEKTNTRSGAFVEPDLYS